MAFRYPKSETLLSLVEEVRQTFSTVVFNGLVAVYADVRTGRRGLVYALKTVAQNQKRIHGTSYRVYSFSQMLEMDWKDFDGLVIAFPALDSFLPHSLTKGMHFFPLEKIYLRQDRQAQLVDNGDKMIALFSNQKLVLRSVNKRNRLPARLAGLHGLSALWQNPSHLAVLMDADVSPQARLQYLDPAFQEVPPFELLVHCLEAMMPKATSDRRGHIVTFAELWRAADKKRKRTLYFIEQRRLHRALEQRKQLAESLLFLAKSCQIQAGISEDEQETYLRKAYAFALEAWFEKSEIEVDDLIAVLPHTDLEQFMATGACILIYQTLPENMKELPHMTSVCASGTQQFRDLVKEQSVRFGGPTFVLHPLIRHLPNGQVNMDLAPVFYNSGRYHRTVRNTWILVENLLGEGVHDYDAAYKESLLNTLLHLVVLCGLDAPWKLGMNAHHQLLHGIYQLIIDLTDEIHHIHGSGTTQGRFALRLHQWFSFYQKSDEDSVRFFRTMRESHALDMPEHPLEITHPEMEKRDDRLKKVMEALAQLFSGNTHPSLVGQGLADEITSRTIIDTPHSLYNASDFSKYAYVPSDSFIVRLEEYISFLQEVHQLRSAIVPEAKETAELNRLLGEVRSYGRDPFCLPHEKKLLLLLYQRLEARLERQKQELKGSANVQLIPKNYDWFAYKKNVASFSLQNRSNVVAQELGVTVEPSELFKVTGHSKATYSRLVPGEKLLVIFDVIPYSEGNVPVSLTLSFHDPDGTRREKSIQYRPAVSSLDQTPFKPKRNPYVYGPPVETIANFFGRRELILNLVGELAGGERQNTWMRAARRVGKTSLLKILQLLFHGDEVSLAARRTFDIPLDWDHGLSHFSPIFVDLHGMGEPTEQAFYRLLKSELLKNYSDPNATHIFSENESPSQYFQEFLMSLFPPSRAEKLVMIIDEFELFETFHSEVISGHFRHIISHVNSVVWLLASAKGRDQGISHYGSPLFNIFSIQELTLFDQKEVETAVLAPWTSTDYAKESQPESLKISGDAVQRIFQEGGGHPYFIQLICNKMIERVNAQKTNYVMAETIDLVIAEIVGQPTAAEHFKYHWDSADLLGRAILAELLYTIDSPGQEGLWDRLKSRYHLGVGELGKRFETQFQASLNALFDIGTVQRSPLRRIVFTVPVFRKLLVRKSKIDSVRPTRADLMGFLSTRVNHE